MKDFPSCFGESGVQVADSSSSSSTAPKHAQNVVTCVYKCRLNCRSCIITVTWTKNLMGQTLSLAIDDFCKVDIKPWLFSKRKGCRSIELDDSSGRILMYWDLANAKFGSGPEPLEGFYLAIVFDREMVLLLGDMKKEAYKKINTDPVIPSSAIFVAKRENIFGKKSYGAKAQFCDKGRVHDIAIECDLSVGGLSDPCLMLRIDNKTVMQVRRLRWKFRGNHTILVDGIPVEVFWDVHNWLFGNNNGTGNAVFMFQSCISTSPEEKVWSGAKIFDPASLLDSKVQGAGFSMILYAWKSE